VLEQVSELLDERIQLDRQVDGVQQRVGDRGLVRVVLGQGRQQMQPRRRRCSFALLGVEPVGGTASAMGKVALDEGRHRRVGVALPPPVPPALALRRLVGQLQHERELPVGRVAH